MASGLVTLAAEPEGSTPPPPAAETAAETLRRDRAPAGLIVAPIRVSGRMDAAVALSRDASAYAPAEERAFQALAGDLSAALQNARVLRELHGDYARTAEELRLAARIQQGLLPARPPEVPGLRVRTLAHPARRVSGDFYGFTRGFDGAVGVYVGDVAGKGVPAALVMAVATNVFREAGKRLHTSEEVLAEVNTNLANYLGRGVTYVTAVHALMHPRRLDLSFAKAGHEKPLVYRAADASVESLDAEGTVLGMFGGARFEPRRVRLQPGDVVLLFTDGIVDASSPAGEKFGCARLAALLAAAGHRGAPGVVAALDAQLRAWVEEAALRDDVTAVAIEAGFTGWEEVVFPGSREEANRVKAQLYEFIEGLPFDRATFEDLKFVVKEMVNNAVEHGHRNDRSLHVALGWRADGETLSIRVRDSGQGFDPTKVADPVAPENIFRPRGRGIYLARKLMDSVTWNAAGNEILLTKRLPEA